MFQYLYIMVTIIWYINIPLLRINLIISIFLVEYETCVTPARKLFLIPKTLVLWRLQICASFWSLLPNLQLVSNIDYFKSFAFKKKVLYTVRNITDSNGRPIIDGYNAFEDVKFMLYTHQLINSYSTMNHRWRIVILMQPIKRVY